MLRRSDDAPALWLYLSEPGRALAELGLYSAARPLVPVLPVGDGHPVLVLPGLLGDDVSTQALRAVLRRRGYAVHGWRLGRNVGPTAECLEGMRSRLSELRWRYDRPVSLIGWSLGGIYARLLARESPTSVRQVITLASPFRMARRSQSRAQATFERYSHLHVVQTGLPVEWGKAPLRVPATAIYSRLDGIVDWRACIERSGQRSENIAVTASHTGIGHHPATIYAVADRLAQPEGAWSPFRPQPPMRWLFPRPDEPDQQHPLPNAV
jgi:pimeloyl-ACP methyl ester carboxylesterase